MKKVMYILVMLLCLTFVSAISAPIIKQVYTPKPVIHVIFDDPTNISIPSSTLAKGFVDVFGVSNDSNSSGIIDLKLPIKINNTFIFEPYEVLTDDSYTFKITAEDFFGNTETFLSKFTIVQQSFNVSLVDPSYGVSNSPSFDIKVDSFVNATCKYSNVLTSFENSNPFDDDGNLHTFDNYGPLLKENKGIPFYVTCESFSGEVASKQFLLSFDTTPPIIDSLSAPDTWNNKVVEPAKIATLQVITDEETICEYSQNDESYKEFSGDFSKTNSKVFVGLKDLTTHNFKVKCKNKAELYSEVKEIDIEVNTGLGLGIDVISPTPYVSSLTVPFIISTSKSASCSLSIGDNEFDIPMSNENGTDHFYSASVLVEGNHSYQVLCNYFKPTGPDFITEDINFVVDTSPPVVNNVTDQGSTNSLTSLTASVDAIDSESGIKYYYFAIGSTSYDADIKNWSKTISPSLSASSLNLSDGSTYYFLVIVQNNAGMNSSMSTSSGVLVNSSYVTGTTVVDNKTVEVSAVGCISDADSDGYGLGCDNGYDCDGTDFSVNLNNCFNGCIQDGDGDAFGPGCDLGSDCDDLDSTIHFGCSNKCRIDTDGDSFGPGCVNGVDCDDFDKEVTNECSSGCSFDLECDGMADEWETLHGLDISDDDSFSDPDGDGFFNLDEYRNDQDPNVPDKPSEEIPSPTPDTKPPEQKEGIDFMFLLIVFVVVLLLGLGGYYGYTTYVKKPTAQQSNAYAQRQSVQQRYSSTRQSMQKQGLTVAQRKKIAVKKSRELKRNRMSKTRSSYFDVFSSKKSKVAEKSFDNKAQSSGVKLSTLGKKLITKPVKPKKSLQSIEFKGLSDFVDKKSTFDKLGKISKSQKDAFSSIERLNKRDFNKLDGLIKRKGASQRQLFNALSKVGKTEKKDFVEKLDNLIKNKKKKR